ncbi:hypothetical protein SCUCBS95973_003387 [Sporothrix curviconia]|uniref:Inositolphosphotransferase Aur1/Ipt1 domain-containing protein n=1 Tax=Sporothrix curviconia TaxID=1260050 RepID=A0ABP0BEY0_9PEZI
MEEQEYLENARRGRACGAGSNALDGHAPCHAPKHRRLFGSWIVRTPNSSRFADHFHSRVFTKFPFLVEVFYWAISFYFYRLTGVMTQKKYGGASGLWDIALGHGVGILEMESRLLGFSALPGKARWAEYRIQQWYLTGADGGDFRGLWLTILDRGYSLIHIPGTVGFIAFYYWYAPTFNRFAAVRRMMTLLNMCAFLIFLLYPTMPPRFLPPEFGFVDTVNAEDAQSVWMSGRYVNKLAAMPSMHFGYAFAIGCVFIYESGFLQQFLSRRKMHFLFYYDESEVDDGDGDDDDDDAPSDNASSDEPGDAARPLRPPPSSALYEKSLVTRCLFLFFGVFYPSWILLTIVATANHYFMDAVVATLCVFVAFLCNRVLLNFYPLEDWLLWALRLEKPRPTTGWRRRQRLQKQQQRQQQSATTDDSRLAYYVQEPTMAGHFVMVIG